MATTSILVLLVALSALAIYSNAAPQAPGQAYLQGGQYPGNGAAPQVGPYQGYPPPPYSGYPPQYPGYQQPPQYPNYQYPQNPNYQYLQYPQSQYPGYQYPQDSGYNQYHNLTDKGVDPLTVPQYGNGERHGSYEEVNLTNKNRTTDRQKIRTGVFGIGVAEWGYQTEVKTEGGSKHKKHVETW